MTQLSWASPIHIKQPLNGRIQYILSKKWITWKKWRASIGPAIANAQHDPQSPWLLTEETAPVQQMREY